MFMFPLHFYRFFGKSNAGHLERKLDHRERYEIENLDWTSAGHLKRKLDPRERYKIEKLDWSSCKR